MPTPTTTPVDLRCSVGANAPSRFWSAFYSLNSAWDSGYACSTDSYTSTNDLCNTCFSPCVYGYDGGVITPSSDTAAPAQQRMHPFSCVDGGSLSTVPLPPFVTHTALTTPVCTAVFGLLRFRWHQLCFSCVLLHRLRCHLSYT